jgi:CDP-4-dehydro-6-deoxyglucose reductase
MELLTLSRAARLAGVTRGVLQKKIRDGELASFEGMVRIDALLRAFPEAALEDNAELARVSRIKERAFARRVYERALPDKEVLAARLGALSLELAAARASAGRLQALLRELGQRLEGHALGAWLARQLEKGMASSDEERRVLAQEQVMRVMAPHVKLVPGGEEFFVEGADTVLDAALHAGLGMAYGCSAGNCGECKARVLAGSVRQVRHHDYRLSEAEKAQGYALMCCCTALTDVVLEAKVARFADEIPQQAITAHVRRMDNLSSDVMLLELLTPRTSRLRFLAGQSARVELGGAVATWPIASCPCEERRLQFHVRRLPGNVLSDYVYGRLRVGEAVGLTGPVGDFVLREDGTRPLVFIAWGWQGFAPVKSVIEHALAQDAAESIELFWIGAHAGDHYHPKLCRSWAEAMDNFRYTPLVAGAGLHGEVTQAVRAALAGALRELASLPDRDFYVAGDAAQVAASRAFLAEQGLPPPQLVTWTAH